MSRGRPSSSGTPEDLKMKKIVSEHIRALRKGGIGSKHIPPLSREKLAEKLGVGLSTVEVWENSERLPSLANLSSLSVMYGVSTDWILGLQRDWLLEEDSKIAVSTTGLSAKAIDSIIHLTGRKELFARLGDYEFTEGDVYRDALCSLLCLPSLDRYLDSGYLLETTLNSIRDEISKGNNDYSGLQDKIDYALFSFTERMKELADALFDYNSVKMDLRDQEIRRAYARARRELAYNGEHQED